MNSGLKIYFIVVTICAFSHAILALLAAEYGYGLGLLGGAGAWTIIALEEFNEDKP